MAYDEKLASRVRTLLGSHAGVTERRMFGGLCFLIQGHMVAGILGADLILRVGPDAYATALSRPHVEPFDFTGRPSKGTVYVRVPAITTDRRLAAWLGPVAKRIAALPRNAASTATKASRRRATG